MWQPPLCPSSAASSSGEEEMQTAVLRLISSLGDVSLIQSFKGPCGDIILAIVLTVTASMPSSAAYSAEAGSRISGRRSTPLVS